MSSSLFLIGTDSVILNTAAFQGFDTHICHCTEVDSNTLSSQEAVFMLIFSPILYTFCTCSLLSYKMRSIGKIGLYFHHQSHPQLGAVFTLAPSPHSFWSYFSALLQ